MCNVVELSVVIGTYNLKEKLLLVLDSLDIQTLEKDKFEVIIVDSSSTDGTKEAVLANNYSFELEYLTQKNTGKASARNTGIKKAKAELILITDADMIADKDLLKEHLRLQKKYNKNIIIEGNTLVLSEEKLPVINYVKRPYVTHNLKNEQRTDFYYCLTGNLSMPKKFFEEANYFDERYKNYGWEDVDLGYRLIRKLKKRIIYAKNAVNYHYHVWSNYEEVLRKEKMGESVNLVINKYPELKSFLGINIFNQLIYLFLNNKKKLINKWKDNLKANNLSKLKRIVLSEYFFQKGYIHSRG